METIPLTIVILTQNEADNIERCLKSVAWASEIMIIDNSTDNTLEIAKKVVSKGKLKVFKKSVEDFSQLRNFGLDQATCDWVLFVDADEEVSEGLAHEIFQKIRDLPAAKAGEHVTGYYLKRKDYFLGKWLNFGETGNIKLLKLGRKDAGKWKRRVHEVWEIQGQTSCLQELLLHNPHPTVAEFLSRINRWTTLDAQEFYDQGVRSSWWKIIVYPVGKFMRNYIAKLGFRDGMPGLIMALLMSFHSFLTRAKLHMLQNTQ